MCGEDSEKQTLPGRIAGLRCLERTGIRALTVLEKQIGKYFKALNGMEVKS